MNIALRKWTLSPVRLVLECSSNRSLAQFVVVSLQVGCKETTTNSIRLRFDEPWKV
jgi:hypothetical protein